MTDMLVFAAFSFIMCGFTAGWTLACRSFRRDAARRAQDAERAVARLPRC